MKILVTVPFIVLGVILALAGAAPVVHAEGGGIRFDWTITLGQLISALLLAGAILAGYTRLIVRLERLELQVSTMWRAWVEDHRRKEEDQ